MERRVALLRAVNVGGRKLAMAELRAIASHLGWRDAATYIQSGNLLFGAPGEADALETALEAAIRDWRRMEAPVIVRDAGQWARILASNPFPKETADEPNRVMLFVSKRPPAPDAAARLQARAAAGEQVEAAGGILWCHFPAGVGTSKLTPAAIERACGSPTTGRNHRTAAKLQELLGAGG